MLSLQRLELIDKLVNGIFIQAHLTVRAETMQLPKSFYQ